MTEPIQFFAQLYDVRSRKDGGGRIQLEFGADAMHAIVKLMALNASGETNLALAIVPVTGSGDNQQAEGYTERVDPETGELVIG